MTKCLVRSVRKWSAGSTRDAASAWTDNQTTAISRNRLIRRTRRNPGHVSEEVEVAKWRHVHAGERALRHCEVGLVPQADVRQIASDDALHLLEEREAALVVPRCTRL